MERLIRRSGLAALSLAALLATTPRAQSEPAQQPAPPTGLIVHEWGTFTSMQGADGQVLEGLHHEEEGLPDFVHDVGKLLEVRAAKGVKMPSSHVIQKMETPVIYFHTERPMRVRATVYYPNGLLTQFYPVPQVLSPRVAELRRRLEGGRVDFRKVRLSTLEWNVDLRPFDLGPPPGIPEVDPEDPWAEARRVRAAYVTTVDTQKVGQRAESEHYLFYRGLARKTLPLVVHAETGGRATVTNGFSDPVPFAIAVEIGDRGGRVHELGTLDPEQVLDLGLDQVPLHEDIDDVVGELTSALHRALLGQGLHEDEARAMVATWSKQWFRSPGQRVLYVVPRRLVDHTLPLMISPEPDDTVRVLVGRLEYLTPEQERSMETALLDLHSDAAARRGAAESFLEAQGRFLEPKLRRAIDGTADDHVRRIAEEVLERRFATGDAEAGRRP